MEEEKQQYYLRAEPTTEGRRALRAHQQRLAEVFESLRLNPRLTKTDDLHWTTVFLGSPQRWTRAFRACGVDRTLSTDDLLALTIGDGKLPKIALASFGSSTMAAANVGSLQPTYYDALYKGTTNAVFVLRFDVNGVNPARRVLDQIREALHLWEREDRVPGGTAAKFFRHPLFPLRRELNGGYPHVTLARGRVSRERQRDVLRSIRATRLATREPISFRHTDIRIARSPAIVSVHA